MATLIRQTPTIIPSTVPMTTPVLRPPTSIDRGSGGGGGGGGGGGPVGGGSCGSGEATSTVGTDSTVTPSVAVASSAVPRLEESEFCTEAAVVEAGTARVAVMRTLAAATLITTSDLSMPAAVAIFCCKLEVSE